MALPAAVVFEGSAAGVDAGDAPVVLGDGEKVDGVRCVAATSRVFSSASRAPWQSGTERRSCWSAVQRRQDVDEDGLLDLLHEKVGEGSQTMRTNEASLVAK